AQEAAVVEVAAVAAEVAAQEILVVAFLDVVKAAPPAGDGDDGVGDARGGDAGAAEQLATEQLRQVAGVLQRVGQVELVQAVEALALDELVHVDGHGRLGVDALEAAGRPLQV